MDYTEAEDFEYSEAWLSEKIFSQLKDFNETTNSVVSDSENKFVSPFLLEHSSMPITSAANPIDLSLQNKTFIDLLNNRKIKSPSFGSIDTYEALADFKELNLVSDINNIESPSSYALDVPSLQLVNPNLISNVNPQTSSGILNLKQELLHAQQHRGLVDEQLTKIEENNHDDIDNLFIDPADERSHNMHYNVEDPGETQVLLIQDENAENYYEMMDLQENCTKDNIVIFEENLKEPKDKISFIPYSQFIKCMHCDEIFEYFAFTQHICEYDSNKNYIFSEEEIKQQNIVSLNKLLEEDKKYFADEPACIRQLRENNAKISKFLKDSLRYDVDNPEGVVNRKTDGVNECTLCERKFVHASGLARHMEKHAFDLIPSTTNASSFENGNNNLKVMVKCITCGRVFFSAKNGLDHFNENHQITYTIKHDTTQINNEDNNDIAEEFINAAIQYLNKITDDGNSSNDIKTENSYFKVIILNSILQCEFCDFLFTDVSNLLKHSATHDPLRGFECTSCEINVSTSKEIFLHYQAECVYSRELLRNNHNLQKLFVCNVCENKFSTLEQLLDHRYTSLHLFPRLNKALNVLQSCCEYCGIIFETASDILKHHDEKHFKKSINSGYTKRDLTTPKPRQYLCDVCGKSYTQSSHLWQHLRFHRGVKPFACSEPDCNRKFTIRPDLNDHIRKCHTGERPYHCLICGKRFLTGSVFYQHRLIHRGERRYGCEECGKRFYRADALKNHLRIHTGEKPYSCLYCSKNFRQRGDRDKHSRARHANLDENAKNILTALKNGTVPPTKVIPPPQRTPVFTVKPAVSDDVVFVGNVPFPASMFKPIVSDIENQNK